MSGDYHASRLTEDGRRTSVWQALWRYHFRHHVHPTDTVLDLGAGYGDFINNVVARRRIALDMWPGMVDHVASGVETIVGPADDLAGLEDGAIDYTFASNLFEHLPQEALVRLLAALKPKLSARGSLTMLQPNYRYAYREYFDDYTHVAIYSHVSLPDLLAAHGWEVVDVRPRFLPLSVKSRLPTWPLLVWAYLRSPFKPLGKQMLIVARPRA
ncbi:class I SAM-dependent methyltransferase [Sphingobium sp.]|jgi:SAM-dependent methyltransferase|uniref:class I SAM-dependent methyltransferase n=1 Tax=Sphingobium sp. TaxID=1912891 RepID=UPI00257AF6AE|nr:class I SAM-dependent methyltransferase [Sphingobium sp.]MBR2269578.1 class I SAM-dependent methyltransferase [Sphingobium sp.]